MKPKSKQSRRVSMSLDTTLNVEKQIRQGHSSFRPLSASTPRLIANALNSQVSYHIIQRLFNMTCYLCKCIVVNYKVSLCV